MLLKERRFLPLFLTQFFGAFNDNLLKNAIVMLITFRITGDNAQTLVVAAGAIFILPYFILSATSGQFADKMDRARLTRLIKLVEIGIMVCAGIGFMLQNVYFLLLVLFGMGVHSTFFGPIKYALLPQHLQDNELLIGNAYIEAGSFLAILLGTILGGVLMLQSSGPVLISSALMLVAVAGYGASRFIPEAPPPEPQLKVDLNLWRATWAIVGFSRQNPRVYRCIIGASWFWLVGMTYLSQFPALVKDVLQAQPLTMTLFLTCFSLGIGVGSFLCNALLRGSIQSTYVPVAALLMGLAGVDLWYATSHFSGGLTRIYIDLFLIAAAAGMYIVPLYTIMQHDSPPEHRARIIAANNIVNAIYMVGSAIAVLVLLAAGLTIPQVLLVMAIANGLIAPYCAKLRRRSTPA